MLACTGQVPETPARVRLCSTSPYTSRQYQIDPFLKNSQVRADYSKQTNLIPLLGKVVKRQLCLWESTNMRLRYWRLIESSVISAAVTLDSACVYFVLTVLLHNGVYICLGALTVSWPLGR